MISVEAWKNLTQPVNQCSMVNAPYDELDSFNITNYLHHANTSNLIACKSWEFDMSLIGKTIISEWGLVCDKGYLSSVVESCFLAGKIFNC